MRKFILLLVFTFVTFSTLYAAETVTQKDIGRATQEIGRYQLFQGMYTTFDLKYRQTSSSHNAVFLLDTVTGQVKRYVNRIDEDGTYIETWLPTAVSQQQIPKKIQVEGK